MKLENKDVTSLFYPLMIFLSGWYIISNIIRLFTIWYWQPMMIVYTIIWMLLPISILYLYFKNIRLHLKWSYLFIIGFIIIIIFLYIAIITIFRPEIGVINLFFTGWWDHTFFPIVFGMLFLCDKQCFPKIFWIVLIPFAIFNLIPNLNILSNLLYDSWIINNSLGNGPPGFFSFFGVNNWNEYFKIIDEPWFNWSFGTYLREQLTFFSIIPLSILYYCFKRK